ncbi:C4-dicarboxylate transporter/malic acid transport protein [Micromonospora sp. MW-13]|uniref:TDT family transporter n=1 Tax=unclassified Micromonospora TaxID=2617518 RepID=UPI000E42F284|nr:MULTISPECIES: TDT family transporter [unclassified Micromonospora]MCX4469477.1 TDT family transporter [Micromonospora sp. NBC_01655]RGC65154.1 C4-dicarboxylate transporter/malic acid transport protein [Micromonospora sp. MW-13]
MTTSTLPRPAEADNAPRRPRPHPFARFGLLRSLDHPRDVLANLTPNWYASIMGTGIVATAAASLPLRLPGLRLFATVVWALAALLLLGLTVATVAHWLRHPRAARGHHADPVMAHFYGAPPMAMLTVGAGTLLLGRDVIGLNAAVGIGWVLWFAGTITGLVTAAAVPYLQFTRHEGVDQRSAFGGWLMPVVPPMVSASVGALLVPYAPAGQARMTLVLACYAMFGLSLIASLIVITLIWNRLILHKIGPARMVPTLWIVLGPLGQSITAANLLGGVAAQALPGPYAHALQAFGVVYGIPVWGFALLWAGLAAAITIKTARDHLPFSLTWWSFTFPVGTCVTGTSGLALHTGSTMFRTAAVIFYAGLLTAWAAVAVRTATGSLRGTLFARVPDARTV